jgi:putative transposase
MREEGRQRHRGRAKEPNGYHPTSHCATGPGQVWSWDITYLSGAVKGAYLYLYLILDIFSRKIVAWEVWSEENTDHASDLITRGVMAERREGRAGPGLVLHSDNGSPMKAATYLGTLRTLGIVPSKSRPRVSDDNPYSESLFRTMKYRPAFPGSFADLEEARRLCAGFVAWYNEEHLHRGLKYLTPSRRHDGSGEAVLVRRHRVCEEAKKAHPERWKGRDTRDWTLPKEVWLNPDRRNERSFVGASIRRDDGESEVKVPA